MGRSTRNRNTRNPKEPSSIKINTSNAVLCSIDPETNKAEPIVSLGNLVEYKQEVVGDFKTIEHTCYTTDTTTLPQIFGAINQFVELCQKIFDWYEANEAVIKEQDAFTSDVLHEIELGSPKDIGRAYKTYSKLRTARQSRRKAKNENKMLSPLRNYLIDNPKLVKELIKVKDRCAGIQYDVLNASYSYKTTMDTE